VTQPATPHRIRVLRIITRLNIGGPSIQAARLTLDLSTHGYTTTLLHGRLGEAEGDMRYLLPDTGVDVRYVDSLCRPISPVADIRTLWTILRTLREIRPAIVHTHMAKAGLLGRIATLMYNWTTGWAHPARVVHTYHGHVLEGYFRPWQSAAFIHLERLLARSTDVLIAISPRVLDELVEQFRIAPRSTFHLVPLGFDLAGLGAVDDESRAVARAALGMPPDALVITTVGRLTAIKNHELFLEVAAVVARQTPQALFLIVGDGERRAELERLAAAAGLAERVRFLGWRRDLATVYGATDIFVLTSRNEGTPVALIEAMAAGVPGVSTAVGGVPDVITDEDVGRSVPSENTAALAAAIQTLSVSPEMRRTIGLRARASVLGRYAQERLVLDIVSLYDRVLRS
jgi:glycosyltransferase involved in cell wall biosynthesis